ncbi:MAG: universal stress protein [Bacteroidales bacterium]|jgi:nucleotide-binding universal stress UspA family protein|nr:universal stress protein [Bacteroidales bacterium]
MKNIIVGIDFSEGSLNAMKNAIFIAEKFKSKLTLLFVITFDAKIIIGADKLEKTELYSFVETKLKKLAADCKKALPQNIIKYKIRTGKVSKEINTEAKEQGNALIILGTHGCSGFKEIFIGSSAFRVISGSSCPVLTVRYGARVPKNFTEILVVIDDTMETLQKLRPAANIAKQFFARVHVVGLYPPQFPDIRRTIEKYVKKTENYFVGKNIRHKTTFIENNKDTKIDTVLKYAKEHEINLIIIMKEVELAGENVFILAPFSERIVNRSPIPILTVNVNPLIYPGKNKVKDEKRD